MADLIVPPQAGDRRFVCECGGRYDDPGVAVAHTFAGHEVGIERYGLGSWVWDHHTTVEQFIIERLRAKGENVGDYVRRIQERAEAARLAVEQMEAGVNGW